MVGGRRVEGVFKNHIGFRKTRIHITLADFDVLEQIAFLVDLRDAFLTRLNWIRDDGLEVELRFDQRRRLLGDILSFRGDDGKRVAHIADAFADADHHRPIVNDQSMIVFAGNIFGS